VLAPKRPRFHPVTKSSSGIGNAITKVYSRITDTDRWIPPEQPTHRIMFILRKNKRTIATNQTCTQSP